MFGGSALIAALLVLITPTGASAFFASTASDGDVAVFSQMNAWQPNYQTNLRSSESCEKRGYALVHYEPDTVGKIINWQCHGPYGSDNRWAIVVLWRT